MIVQSDTTDAPTPAVTADFAREHLSSIGAANARLDASIFTLTAILIAMAGYLASHHPDLTWGIRGIPTIGAVMGMLLALGAFTYAFTALLQAAFPRPRRANRSLIDVRAIADRTPQQFKDAYLSIDEFALLDDLTRQIHDRAQLLAVKQDELKKAFTATLLAVPAWLLGVGILS